MKRFPCLAEVDAGEKPIKAQFLILKQNSSFFHFVQPHPSVIFA
jgi:hypothetical protein